jgi:hypothetical protein
LLQVLTSISQLQFNNIDPLKDPDGALQSASDRYQKYQSLEDQVKSGKTVSASEFKELDPEIQGFFQQMANGSYKMTGDAKTFYETINAFKLDGFRNAIVSVEEEFTKLNNIKSSGKDFNY